MSFSSTVPYYQALRLYNSSPAMEGQHSQDAWDYLMICNLSPPMGVCLLVCFLFITMLSLLAVQVHLESS